MTGILQSAMSPDLFADATESARYRVFISYSRADRAVVERIAEIITELGLTPMWDRGLEAGSSFSEQIRRYIAHAHLFLPFITQASENRNWVQQEIGYAVALSVPIIPLTSGVTPGEMLRELHAIEIRSDIEELRSLLSWAKVDAIVQRYRQCRALYQCADYSSDRAEMMATYCDDVISLGYTAIVRQKGGLTSFHIPNRHINHPEWAKRYGGKRDEPDHNRLKRQERIALEKHARGKGCKLMINPYLTYEHWGPEARLSRLRNLSEFLASMDDETCAVAIHPSMTASEGVTILGDWFYAETVASEIGRGYRQTIFSRHAPTILNRIENFDEEFEELLRGAGVRENESRRAAITLMEELIRGG